MTEDELLDKALSSIKNAKSDMTKLQSDRQKWLRYYNQDKTLYPSEKGRSSVVTSDVHDTVEALMPSLMDVFYGSADVVKTSPQGPEDEGPAKLMEELINFQFQKELNGYRVLHDWFKAALLMKISFVKYWWEKDTVYNEVTYEDLTIQEYQILKQNPDLTIEKTEQEVIREAEFGEMGEELVPPEVKITVKGKEAVKISRPQIEYVPEDEVIFNVREKDGTNPDFIAHWKRIHKRELVKYGIDDNEFHTLSEQFDETLQEERFKDLGGTGFFRDPDNEDFAYIYECFINDFDKEGRKQPKIVLIWGNKVLNSEDNKYGKATLIPLSPYLSPGRMAGNGVAEKAIDAQDIGTTLNRCILDNIYFQNLGMKIVNPFRVEVEDFLSGNKPGGMARTKDDIDPSTAIYPVPITPLPPQVFEMLSLNESRKENKTGVNKYSMGSDSREVNRTATGVSILSQNAQVRTKQIARNFAETGVKALFTAIVDMNLKFLDVEYNVQLNQQWATITRDSIKGKFDLIIDVGLGTGEKEIKVTQMIQMFQVTMPALQSGILSPETYLEQLKVVYENMGYKNTDRFVRPGPVLQQQPGQQGPSPEEIKLQMEMKRMEMQMQMEQQRLQMEMQKQQMEMEMEQQRHKQEMMFKAEEHHMDMTLKHESHQHGMAISAEQAKHKMATAKEGSKDGVAGKA